MITLNKTIKNQILNHAKDCYPKECCGLIVGGQYVACNNLATDSAQFYLDPNDWINAEKQGEIQAIVHSHPDGSSEPSQVDKAQMPLHGLPWVIVGYPQGDFAVHEAQDYTAPLLGREYYHGLQDCYALLRVILS